jgi:hypothetical protein
VTRLADLLPRLPPEMTPDTMGCNQPDVDPDLFFEDGRQHEARAVCIVRCSVRAVCLAWVMNAERGKTRTAREGVYAGLDPSERWDLDTTAPGERRRQPAADDLACGTAAALLRHLQQGEDVDSTCWSAEARRAVMRARAARKKRAREKKAPAEQPAGLPAEPVIAAAIQAAEQAPQPAHVCERDGCRIRTAHGHDAPRLVSAPAPAPEPEAPPAPAPAEAAVTEPETAPGSVAPEDASPAEADVPECGTPEAFQRHKARGEIVDPVCWNAAGRRRYHATRAALAAS